jgi:hypothetical protein
VLETWKAKAIVMMSKLLKEVVRRGEVHLINVSTFLPLEKGFASLSPPFPTKRDRAGKAMASRANLDSGSRA